MRLTICADRGIAWGEVLSEVGADNVRRDDIPDGDRWTAILSGGGGGSVDSRRGEASGGPRPCAARLEDPAGAMGGGGRARLDR